MDIKVVLQTEHYLNYVEVIKFDWSDRKCLNKNGLKLVTYVFSSIKDLLCLRNLCTAEVYIVCYLYNIPHYVEILMLRGISGVFL